MLKPARIRVAVLRGGPSYAYDDSLRSGAHVLSLLREMPEKYEPIDVFISRVGEWHSYGMQDDPHKILSRADVVWNAMHGPFGEDGGVQKVLEGAQIPFAGSGTFASALAYNKDIAKNVYKKHSLLSPQSIALLEDFSDSDILEIFRTFMHPVIVKPASGSRAVGIRLATTFQELKDAVRKTFAHAPRVMVEEYVRGRVSTCSVIENAKGESYYALVPTGRQSVDINKKIEEMAKEAHMALGQRHFSSSDFIVTPKGRIYILETNSYPALHEESLLNHALVSTGWKPKDFVDHCLKLSLGNLE